MTVRSRATVPLLRVTRYSLLLVPLKMAIQGACCHPWQPALSIVVPVMNKQTKKRQICRKFHAKLSCWIWVRGRSFSKGTI
uniref:Putative secreted protein n=1 Tax=Anopheles triannulatus TaxID=58253 RepID=A0A2M4B6E3_9DIPT